ncbi:MAG: CoA activase [Chloroflexi bacterium]|nr:CoA activase [Chloroflexota bacterium]
MIVGGCDIGSTTGKAVVMKDGEILSSTIIPSTTRPEETARIAMDQALRQAGLSSINDLDYIVGTGYGRLRVPFAKENISEISCHARGAQWMSSTIRTVVDIGGQDCKVMSIDDRGKVIEFVMNDRCAAGTGKFFEGMARTLNCGLEGLSSIENQGQHPCTITSQCSVFAESEIVTLINEGNDLKNIIAGINNAVAGRLNSMVRKVGLVEGVALTGGCAKNAGLAKALEKQLGVCVRKLPQDPQIAGAVGAAILAAEKVQRSPSVRRDGASGDGLGSSVKSAERMATGRTIH